MLTDVELQPLAVAKLLKALVDKEQPGLIILGKQAIDDDANQTGQMLAALANLPQATFASKVEVAGDKVNVTREIDGGLETLSLSTPAVITTDLRTAALQFADAPAVVSAVIPGARTPEQVLANVASMSVAVPTAFWAELKQQQLIAADAPVPTA